MKLRVFLLSAVVILAMAGVIGADVSDGGVIELYDCGVLDVPNGHYVLMNDITTSGTCFDVRADGVTLDLNSHRITGDENGRGITIENFGSATIKNGQISNFHYGLIMENSNNNKITSVSISNNDFVGVLLEDSHNSLIDNSFIQNNYYAGIYLEDAEENRISNSFVINNYFNGVFFDNSLGNTIEKSVLQNNGLDFYIDVSSDEECNNVLSEVTGSDNLPIYYFNEAVNVKDITASQVILCDADNSVLKDVKISPKVKPNNGFFVFRTEGAKLVNLDIENTLEGIHVEDSHNNVFKNCDSSNNYNQGIHLRSSNYNVIENCNFENNEFGLIIDGGSYNSVTNTVIAENRYGLALEGASYSKITNSSLLNNEKQDFHILVSINEECENELIDITWTNDEPILFYHNQSVKLENLNVPAVFLCNADESDLKGIKVISPSKRGGLHIMLSDGVNLQDIIVENTELGIIFRDGRDLEIENISSVNNEEFGIALFDVFDSTLKDGLFIKNKEGISLSGSNNKILGNKIISNSKYGIHLERHSDRNTIQKNKILGNEIGIKVEFYSDNNIIFDNIATDNEEYGIFIQDDSEYNQIYNNLFINLENVNGKLDSPNSWNTTKSSGPNIVNGPMMGGNYWGSPNANGYSETCEDSTDDGFCDESYFLGSGNRDYLPLSKASLVRFTKKLETTDVAVSITISPTNPKLGEVVTAMIIIENLGDMSTNVSLTSGNTWPGGNGSPGGGGGGTCNYCISLNPGENHYIIQDIATPNPGKYTISASVESYILDPNPTNDKAFLEFTVY